MHEFQNNKSESSPESSESNPPLSMNPEKYAIKDKIGEGGMSTIVRVADKDIYRDVAMKLLRDKNAKHKQDRFINEARITGQLEHPNIVPVHDMGIDNQGNPYFTMKIVKGRSLKELIEEYKTRNYSEKSDYPITRMVNVFIGVCNAVAFAHSRGVIHRDLKPANIMVGDYGEVLVMDWGLAKVKDPDEQPRHVISEYAVSSTWQLDQDEAGLMLGNGKQDIDSDNITAPEFESTNEGSVWGTPAYMSPEQAAGHIKDIDERSDIFALGAILYEMLTLNRAVHGNSFKELIKNTREGRIIPIEACIPPMWNVPKELCAITMKALSVDPEKRYRNVRAMRRDIERFVAGRSVSAKEDTLWESFMRLARRNVAASISIASASLILLIVLTLTYSSNLKQRRLAEKALADFKAEQKAREVLTARNTLESARPWRLFFEDDFSDVRVANRWDIIYGKYVVRNNQGAYVADRSDYLVSNGQLRLRGGTPQYLLLKQKVKGDLAIEFDCSQTSDYLNDISIFFDALQTTNEVNIPFSGYLVQFGSHDNTRIGLHKSGQTLHREYASPIIKEVTYHIRVERTDDRIRLYVNDTLRINYQDLDPLYGADRNLIGLGGWGSTMIFDNVKIYKRSAPLKTDIIELADRHLKRGNYSTAADLFSEVLETSIESGRISRASAGKVRADSLAIIKKKLPIFAVNLSYTWPEAKTRMEMADDGISLHLDAQNTYGYTFKPLTNMPLSQLTARDWISLVDLSPLSHMPLKWLSLPGCTQIKSLEPLKGLPLVSLNLESCSSVWDISPLRELPIKELNLALTNVSDLNPLREMPLERLNLNRCYAVHDLEPLSFLPLKELKIDATNIEDIMPLSKLPLENLVMSQTRVADISPLKGLQLKVLSINETGVADLSPLKEMPLKVLQASNSRIKDLAVLKDKPLLRLNLDNCRISELSALKNAPLKDLSLNYCDIAELAELKNLPLRHLSIFGIPISKKTSDMLAGLDLLTLNIDLDEPHAKGPLIAKKSIKYINNHKRSHTLLLYDDLVRYLQGNSTRKPFKAYAEKFGEAHYLAIPLHVTYTQAREFCANNGAAMACPTTSNQFNRLHDYVKKSCDEYTAYFLGLERNDASGNLVWISGDSLTYDIWRSEVDKEKMEFSGHTAFLARSYSAAWKAVGETEKAYFVAEWH
ncbi:MAG: protein kinase [Chitinivibrionales bacterium]|nr:protein kinase [Chitinivibrionales bacterium]